MEGGQGSAIDILERWRDIERSFLGEVISEPGLACEWQHWASGEWGRIWGEPVG